MSDDSYLKSFGRNIGVLSMEEQLKLKNSCIGIAGLGGIGGATLLCLARAGIGKFYLADFDRFDIANLNRQAGANHKTFGRTKVEVMKEQILEINPDLEIKTFNEGIQPHNVEDFVKGCDCIVDAIEYFTFSARELLHKTAHNAKKPIMFSAPLGLSATLLSFDGQSMSFEEYFNIEKNMDPFEKLLRFTVGMAPDALHLKYMDFKKEQLVEMQTGPSFSASVNLGSALIAVEALCYITGKRKPMSAPRYLQIDLLTGKQVRKCLAWGNKGPLQRLKLMYARKKYGEFKELFLKFIN
ncbi:MAG TPA: ThiF family adenylyltransferase [Pseudobdellovibrionaceae bacterium]|nr:ThiF family adenylyltransferase [Pseudobdellovibrionaceae bacterium]